jgi:hypothetical protein
MVLKSVLVECTWIVDSCTHSDQHRCIPFFERQHVEFTSCRAIGSGCPLHSTNLVQLAASNLSSPHICIGSQPHSLCLPLFTSVTVPFTRISQHQPSPDNITRAATSPCSAGRIVYHSYHVKTSVSTAVEKPTVCLSRKHRKIGPGLYGYGTYTRRILSSRPQ